jgi:hypothetical protein
MELGLPTDATIAKVQDNYDFLLHLKQAALQWIASGKLRGS